MQRYFILILLFLSFGFLSCRSPQMQEQIESLNADIKEITESGQYWADVSASKLEKLREKQVLILLEEGEFQLKMIGIPGYPDAKEKAEKCFKAVLEVSGQSHAIQNKEFKKRWPALNWAWGDGIFCPTARHLGCNNTHSYSEEKTSRYWNAWKAFCPLLWGWTIPEGVGAFMIDFIFGWKVEVEGRVAVPPLHPAHVERAKKGLEKLAVLKTEEIEKKVSQSVNVKLTMKYVLTVTEEGLNLYAARVRRYQELPGDRGSFLYVYSYDSYQELWNHAIDQWKSPDGFSGYVTDQKFEIVSTSNDKNSLTIVAEAQGFVSSQRLDEFMKTNSWSEESPNPLSFGVTYIDPSERDEK